jgi:hypothetical protein
MFQVLDEKGSCVGIYKDGNLHFKNFDGLLDKTWNYTSSLKGMDVQYAQIYANGKSLEDACPDNLKDSWRDINNKLRAFITSFFEAKVSLKENCFFDLVPERFLKEYCEIKNRICQHVFDTYEKPSEYTFYRRFSELLGSISDRELQISRSRIADRLWNPQGKKLWQKVNEGHTSVKFNMFSSVTGRLTVTDRSFPILNLAKELRDVIEPTNDWFVELDLNAAEMRIALALAGQKQPDGDLHDICRKEVFNDEVTRSEAKTIATKWLYSSSSEDVKKYDAALSKFYNKEKLLSEYWKNGYVYTPYGRKIEADLHHAISYLNQSTLIDMWHRQLIKADDMLVGKQSFLAFPLHDCGLFDIKEDEKNMLPDLIKTLSDTEYGNFPVGVKIGSDYGNMKKVKIKV